MSDEVMSWDDLRKAIDAYLLSFGSGVIHMNPRHPDKRFPPGFLETFEEIFAAEAGDWSILKDPELTTPKGIMEKLFLKERENMVQANVARMRANKEKAKEKNDAAKTKKNKDLHAREDKRKQRDFEENIRRRLGMKK